ncbi:MAG: Uma2 family endonuclease [Deltaproteobacteria bacterium]|nr:Uma2 family endonuclease [Deltaproteobacteria bacterium]
MSSSNARILGRGPFTADMIEPGSRYELSGGHPILCMPTAPRGGRANLLGGAVLETDPAVTEAGVDVGYSSEDTQLRAPDVAVGNVPDQASWAKGVPLLAVEYADRGQNLEELQTKIDELLSAGTKWIWVVRLSGPRRVEVHEPGVPKRVALPGQLLVAPGVLQNPVRVEELYDESAAHEAQLRNLLQRKGYASLRAALDSSEQAGIEKGEKLGIEKGEKLGIEKGEKLGIEKGEKLGIEKGEKLGIEKGEKLGVEKGEKLRKGLATRRGVGLRGARRRARSDSSNHAGRHAGRRAAGAPRQAAGRAPLVRGSDRTIRSSSCLRIGHGHGHGIFGTSAAVEEVNDGPRHARGTRAVSR